MQLTRRRHHSPSNYAAVRQGGTAIPVLEARGVSYAYDGQLAVDEVTFELHRGEFVALVGPNAAGKSTLLRVLLGLLDPLAGEVRLFGVAPGRLRERWRIGYVPQRPVLDRDLPATVEEIVAAGSLPRSGWFGFGRRSSRADVAAALEAVDLADLRSRRASELSGGQQQRVLIAKALASRPELLILDEPVAGVDAASQRRFQRSLTYLVHEHGGAVLLVSHELGAVADQLDRVIVLKNRVIFDGPPERLAATGVSLGVHREDLPLWLEGLR